MTETNISARDKALAAYQATVDEANLHRAEQERYAERQDLQAFAVRLKKSLGIEAEPQVLTYELDETGVAVMYTSGDLCYVVACSECGRDVPTHTIRNWADLGQAIRAHDGGQPERLCPACESRKRWAEEHGAAWNEEATPPKQPSLEERLLDDLRALIRHEIFRAVESP